MNAHSHVDDYSGTLGGVHKVHISALVTSPKNWVVALSFSLWLSKQTKNELVDWAVRGTWHKTVNSRCLYCINGEWVPVPDGAGGKKETASVLRSGGDEAKLLTVGTAISNSHNRLGSATVAAVARLSRKKPNISKRNSAPVAKLKKILKPIYQQQLKNCFKIPCFVCNLPGRFSSKLQIKTNNKTARLQKGLPLWLVLYYCCHDYKPHYTNYTFWSKLLYPPVKILMSKQEVEHKRAWNATRMSRV